MTTYKPPGEQTITWLLAGHTEADVRAAITAAFPEDHPDDLLQHAARYFTQVAGGDPDDMTVADIQRGFCIAAARDLYRKALEIADYSTALKALKALQSVK